MIYVLILVMLSGPAAGEQLRMQYEGRSTFALEECKVAALKLAPKVRDVLAGAGQLASFRLQCVELEGNPA